MNDADDSELAARARAAARIISHPQGFCVCLGCESICVQDAVYCRSCFGYHFDHDARLVTETARVLGARASQLETMDWS